MGNNSITLSSKSLFFILLLLASIMGFCFGATCSNPSRYSGRSLCDPWGTYCGECVSFVKVSPVIISDKIIGQIQSNVNLEKRFARVIIVLQVPGDQDWKSREITFDQARLSQHFPVAATVGTPRFTLAKIQLGFKCGTNGEATPLVNAQFAGMAADSLIMAIASMSSPKRSLSKLNI